MKQVLIYFRKNYGYIDIQNVNEKIIKKFLEQKYIKDLTFEKQMNYLYDYILSQGLCDVQP